MSFNECSQLILLNPALSQQSNFFDFVYGKIARDTKNRFVNKGTNFIDILPFNKLGIRVLPVFKEINKENLGDLKSEINKASSIILEDSSIEQVYIVCPKNENFNKHIEVRISALESICDKPYKVKVIPYSLNSINRKTCNSCQN